MLLNTTVGAVEQWDRVLSSFWDSMWFGFGRVCVLYFSLIMQASGKHEEKEGWIENCPGGGLDMIIKKPEGLFQSYLLNMFITEIKIIKTLLFKTKTSVPIATCSL